MKAIVLKEYGPPEALELKEVDKPEPKDDEVRIRIHATSVNFGDSIARNFKAISPRKFHMPFLFWLIGRTYFGFTKPKIKILGSEFAGKIDEVGSAVDRFKVGDEVFGYRGPLMGAYAEYLRMPAGGVIALKPANMTFEEAAAIPYGAIMALNLLKKIDLRPEQRLLVVGASGGIGPAVVQLAKHQFGAWVTGVCSTARMDYVRALGADRAIDYTKEDFSASPDRYDFIVDILGLSSTAKCKRVLEPKGRLLFVSFKMKQVFQMLVTSMFGGKKVICALFSEKAEDLERVKELIEEGKLKSIVDKTFPLEQAAEAHRYVDGGQKKGAVVITVAQPA
jgi:NADPH:quinone reductase-like Zn-dependent oxidoreductase